MKGRSRLTPQLARTSRDYRLGRTNEDGDQGSPLPSTSSPIKGDTTQAHPSSLYGIESYMPDHDTSSSKSMSNWPYIASDMWVHPHPHPHPCTQLGSTSMQDGASASDAPATLNAHALSPLSSSQQRSSASTRVSSIVNRDVMDDASETRLATLYSCWKSAPENPQRLPTLWSSAQLAVLGDCLENVKERMSLDSLPMLVQHQIRLEDGSIRTYFSLPRDSTSNVLQRQDDHGKFTSSHDYLSSPQLTQDRKSLLAATNLQEQCLEDVLQACLTGHEVGEDYLRPFCTFDLDSRKRGSLHFENDFHERGLTGLQRVDHTQFEKRLQRELDGLACAIKDANWVCGERSGSSISSDARAREGSHFHDPHDHWSRHHNDSNIMADKTTLQLDSIQHGRIELSEHVYRAFMKYAKILNEYPEERTKLEKQGKGGTLLCLTCKRFSKPYSDTHSLIMHTFMSRKRGLRAEHLGLRKAICTVMGWSTSLEPSIGKRYQHVTSEEAKVNKEDLILWPPALVIHNALARECSDSQARVATELAVKDLFKDAGISYKGIEVVLGNIGSLLVEFSVSSSCLLQAEQLHQHLAAKGCGRDGWLQKSIAGHQESMPKDRLSIMEKSVLYGYLACAHDLELVDTEFRRRCLVLSRKKVAVNSFV